MKSKLALATLVVLALLAGAYYWYGYRPAQEAQAKAARPMPGVPVATADVVRGTVPVRLSVIGRAEAKSSVIVKSRVDGQVASVEFKEGQPVRKGQVLVRLDPSTFEAQLRQSEAARAKDQAQLEKLRQDLARNRELVQKGFMSQAQLFQTEADVLSAEAAIRADTANLDNVKLQLSFTTITAPMDGVAGSILVYPGGVVKVNDTALLVVNQVQPIYVTFSVPETKLAQLKRAVAKGPVSVSTSIQGDSKPPIEGAVAFIDNAVDATTGTIVVKALFANADSALTPGQFANVSLVIDVLEDVLLVPSQAVQSGPNGRFVFVVKPDMSVEQRLVAVATALTDQSVISDGVKAGEKVVTDGQLRLVNGVKVRLVGARGEGKGAASAPGEKSP